MEIIEQQFISGIKKGDMAAFEELYKEYYVFLCLIAEHIVRNPSDAEEIVSDVFIKLWNIRDKLDITTSIKAYLIKAVKNTSLNYLEKLNSEHKLTDSLSNSDYEVLAWASDYPLGQLYEHEILEILDEGICRLPDSCRQIFILSRNSDMKYCDIAVKLGISVNTVKTQMKIALARLRVTLKDYLMVLVILVGF
jgi:RNA polymerase sigma-70 factor (ECF subfamily)